MLGKDPEGAQAVCQGAGVPQLVQAAAETSLQVLWAGGPSLWARLLASLCVGQAATTVEVKCSSGGEPDLEAYRFR